MVRIAIALAVAAVAVAIGVFFFPPNVVEEWSWRASIGSSLTTAIALMLGAIALLVTARVESSDYKAEQQTKIDLAELLAALAMILNKGALGRTGQIKNVDFSEEVKRIEIFSMSTTSFAMYNLLARKSRIAGNKGEEWRLFFVYIAEITSNTQDLGLVVNRAVRLQQMLIKLTRRDLHYIGYSVANLVAGIRDFHEAIDDNVLIKAMHEVVNKEQGGADSELRTKNVMRKFRFLKARGIDDPNIDLFLAVDEGDTAKLQAAIDKGADVNISDAAILQKYETALAQFKE